MNDPNIISPPFPISPPSSTDTVPPPPPIIPKASPAPEPEAGEPAQVVDPIFKKILPILIGLGVIILLFLLVTKVIIPKFSKPKEPEIISLKYWGLWEPESVISQIISDYQVTNPNINIQYIMQSHQDYRERLQSALAKGDGPDIFRYHNTWLPMLKADLSPMPETIYSNNEFDSTFYPVVKKDVFSGGRYYGIPLEFDTLALYINQDIFASMPDLKVPTTWNNLRQTAFKLRQFDETGKKLIRGGIALGTTNNVDNFSDILGLMILQNGGDPGQPDSEAVNSAMQFYTLFATQDKSWDTTLPPSTYSFATEKVAMFIAPSWRALEVKAINPNLNFKLYPAPQLPGTNIAWATYWIEGVSKNSTQSQAAWEFLKYLSTKEVLAKMFSVASQTRLFGEPYSRQDMASNLQADPYVGAILSQAISAQSWPLASRTFDNGINDKLIKYYEDAINSYLKQDSEKTITQSLTQGVTQVLSQYGLSK
ncbi:MAG: extracellular solute-binding protein [Candidatus Beckwithbacteria bacterium]|nr:extracellular solute-binding protein [Patescibacteria group bacterium]